MAEKWKVIDYDETDGEYHSKQGGYSSEGEAQKVVSERTKELRQGRDFIRIQDEIVCRAVPISLRK